MGISSDLPSASAHVIHSRAAVNAVCKTFDSEGQISSRTKILKLKSNSFDLAGFFIVQMIGLIPNFTPNHPIPESEPRILESYNPRYCSCCQKESMVSIQRLPKRGPSKAVFPTVATQF